MERGYLRERVMALLEEEKDEKECLRRIALSCYCCIGYHPNVFGYVIPLRKLRIEKEGFLFVLFVKRPYTKVLFVPDEVYSSLNEVKEETVYYLKHFALFATLTRLRLSVYPPYQKEEEERRKQSEIKEEKSPLSPLY